MQTRDYDDYIHVPSLVGFRQVIDLNRKIDVTTETDAHCNMYVDGKAASYNHSMDDDQLNAIHFFEENQEAIFSVMTNHLAKNYDNPKMQMGMASINILNESKDKVCIAEYKWIDFHQKAVYIRLHRDTVV
ncbi:MAG: hypothetical protein SchgKO_22690 [Schleiferiaceae bacterium]